MDLDDEELLATRKLLGLDKTKIEKSIENLKEYLEKDSLYVLHKKGENKELSDFDKFCIGHCEDIEVLITEYERQKQRNEEHRKINGELREKLEKNRLDDLFDEELKQITTEYLNNLLKKLIEKDYVPKQMIKDKIQEIKEDKESYYYYNFLEERDIEKTIEILQEFLKKEMKYMNDFKNSYEQKIKDEIEELKQQRIEIAFKSYIRKEDIINADKEIIFKIDILQKLLQESEVNNANRF